MPLKEAVLVEDAPASAPAQKPVATASTQPIGAHPNLNVPPGEPAAKLLSPEEKARVIAELEALAKSQGASMSKARQLALAECEKALLALSPEERKKHEQEGLKCK